MQHEIKRIDGSQAGKVLALVSFFMGLILVVILGLGLIFDVQVQEREPTVGFIAGIPFLWAIVGYVAARLFVAVYNGVAARRGGIYLQLGELYDPRDPPWRP